MEPFFQVGVIVENIEAAMDELTRAQNITWGRIVNREYRQWRFRRVFSLDGPPYIELVEGPPGSPWDSSKGSRLDHLQWWTRDMAGDTKRMLAAGLQVDSVKEEELIAPDGSKKPGILRTYFRAPASGIRIELIDESVRAGHRKRWGIESE